MAWTTNSGRVGIGTAAQRPSSAGAGDMWMATDTAVLSVYTGSVWIGINGPLAMVEAAAPGGVAGQDILYPDSTAHRLAMKNNNGSATNVLGASDFTVTLKVGSAGGSYTTSSASYSDMDGTNLAYTVTVPVGWKAWIGATMWGSASANIGQIAITDGTTLLRETAFSGTGNNISIALQHVFTGDGASHTFKLRFAQATSGTLTIVNDTASRAPAMVVKLAPSN